MMKNIIHILLALIIFTFHACTRDSGPIDHLISMEENGVMEIEIIEKKDIPAEDKMETVRFIVFKNASILPILELNELFDIPAVQPGEDEVSRFRILLELSRKKSGRNDKVIIAIINEPVAMKSELDGILNYPQLENVQLQFAHFLNSDHTALQSGKRIPMTGVLFTDKVYATPEEAREDIIALPVQRAVARVEIYINKQAGMDTELGTGTTLTLEKTYDKEFFIRYEDSISSFGKIATVTSGFVTKTWTWQTSGSKEIPVYQSGQTGRLLCSFYTPERTCSAINNADKLNVKIHIACSDGVARSGEIKIDRFRLDGNMTDVNAIIRNNIYRVVTTITSNSLTSAIVDWNSEEIPTEF